MKYFTNSVYLKIYNKNKCNINITSALLFWESSALIWICHPFHSVGVQFLILSVYVDVFHICSVFFCTVWISLKMEKTINKSANSTDGIIRWCCYVHEISIVPRLWMYWKNENICMEQFIVRYMALIIAEANAIQSGPFLYFLHRAISMAPKSICFNV